MKKIVLTILVAAATLFADVDWAIDYQDALLESKESGKPVFVMISSEGCNYCYFMKSQVFTQKKVSEFLNENFIPVELDLKNDPLPDYLKPYGTPTFYIVYISGKRKRVSRPIVGAAKADAFLQRIKKELEAFRKKV
ncbi:thioredoxin family protein [Hydrogenimonas sp.]